MNSEYITLASEHDLLPDPRARLYPKPIRKLTEEEIHELIAHGVIDSFDSTILDAYNEYVVPFAEHLAERLEPIWEETETTPFDMGQAIQNLTRYISETNEQDPTYEAIEATGTYPVHAFISRLELDYQIQRDIQETANIHDISTCTIALNGMLELTEAYGYPQEAVFETPTLSVYVNDELVAELETQTPIYALWTALEPGTSPQQETAAGKVASITHQ